MAMASGTDPLDRLQAGARDLRAERELCHAAADRACRAESGEAFSTRLTSDVPVTNEYDKTYMPCTARQAFEPMAHSGQNNEVSESRGIWVSAQPQHQVSDPVPNMCNMALTTSKTNMQEHYEDFS